MSKAQNQPRKWITSAKPAPVHAAAFTLSLIIVSKQVITH